MAVLSRASLILHGYFQDQLRAAAQDHAPYQWAPHILRGALEAYATLTFDEDEIEEIVTSWLATPEIEDDADDLAGFRVVMLSPGENPADGDTLFREDGHWIAAPPPSPPVPSVGFRGPWAPSTAYAARELVIAPTSATARLRGRLVSANSDFTSGATFSAANWTLAEHAESFAGAFATATDYTAGQVVSYLGQLYSANADFTSAGAFVLADWTPLSTQNAAGVAVTPAGTLTESNVQAALAGLAVRSDSVESGSAWEGAADDLVLTIDAGVPAWRPGGGGAPSVVSAGNLGATRSQTVAARAQTWLVGTLDANHTLTVTLGAGSSLLGIFTQDATGGRTLTVAHGADTPVAVDVPATAGASFAVQIRSPDGTDVYIDVAGAPGPTGPIGPPGPDGPIGNTGPAGGSTPDDGSVTAAKLNAALKPSGSAVDATEAVRALGSAAGNAAKGTHTHANVDIQVFATPGSLTWTKPTGATFVNAVVISPGSAGGSGRRGPAGESRFGGAGGGGGGRTLVSVRASLLGATAPVAVGAAGVGGAAVTTDATNGNPGTNGGVSSFNGSAFARAAGSSGGAGGTTSTAAAAAGSVSEFPGSAGGASATAGTASTGGGAGGGGGGNMSSGNAPSAGGAGGQRAGQTGGAGGAATGAAGSQPTVQANDAPQAGSGGGGAGTGVAGGAGAAGLVGAGGGGGAASADGFASGAGGDGGPGMVIVFTSCQVVGS